MGIAVRKLEKSFGSARVLGGVDLDVRPGELVALLGPSGSGKSTLLRVVAGLEPATSGEVWLGGQRVDGLEPARRGVGFVFQHYALFRHMSARDNVAFGLHVRGVRRDEARRRADALLARVGLAGFGDHHPDELSGGQRQRVALARALAPEPKVLLLDEPFGALDAQVRAELRTWLRQLHDDVGATTVLVTHDQEEALAIADRVVLLRDGRVEQVGAPEDLLDLPASEFVARFVGEVNVLEGVADGAGRVAVGPLVAPVGAPLRAGERVRLVVRSHEIRLHPSGADGVIRRIVPVDDRARVEVGVDGRTLLARVPRAALGPALGPGCAVGVEIVRATAWPTGTTAADPRVVVAAHDMSRVPAPAPRASDLSGAR